MCGVTPIRDCHIKASMAEENRKNAILGRKSALTRLKLAAMLHPGSTVSHPHHREAHTKTTLSFQN